MVISWSVWKYYLEILTTGKLFWGIQLQVEVQVGSYIFKSTPVTCSITRIAFTLP